MAPTNKTLTKKLTYEDVYPLKHTKSINNHRQHNNIWKKTLNFLKSTVSGNNTISKICNFSLYTLSYVCDFKATKPENLQQIRNQLEER